MRGDIFIQTSLKGWNLVLEGFLQGPNYFFKRFALEKHLGLRNNVPIIRGLEA
jgi:hypothetical protein